MKSIIFGFSKPVKRTILSALISKIERREFSHVYIRFAEPILGLDMVFQASGLSLNLLTFAEFNKHSKPVEEYELPVTMDEFLLFWAQMLHSLGKPYSVKQLLRILCNKVFGLQSVGDAENAQICSEAAARMAMLFHIEVDYDLDYITPSDFNKLCKLKLQRVL